MTIKRGGIDPGFCACPQKREETNIGETKNTARKARGLSAHNQIVKAKEW